MVSDERSETGEGVVESCLIAGVGAVEGRVYVVVHHASDGVQLPLQVGLQLLVPLLFCVDDLSDCLGCQDLADVAVADGLVACHPADG